MHFLKALDIDTRNYYFPWYCNYDVKDTSGISIQELGQPTSKADKEFNLDFYFAPKTNNRFVYDITDLFI